MNPNTEKVIIKRLYKFKGDPEPLTNVIYNNFKKLDTTENINHNKNQIRNLIQSDQMIGLTLNYNKKIIGYLIGEFTLLEDGRLVYFMSYIFIAPKYRNKGLGDQLLKHIKKECREFGVYHILLMTDLSDDKVRNFYIKRGFRVDTFLDNKKEKYTPLIHSMEYV